MGSGVFFYLEVISALLALLCVWLAAIHHVLNWPVAMASSLGYIIVFFNTQLYSEAFLNVFFLGFQSFGWWTWKNQLDTKPSSVNGIIFFKLLFLMMLIYYPWVEFIIHGLPQLPIGLFGNSHSALPPPKFPYLDAALMMLSILALIMQSKRWIEHWYVWILVDLFYVPMYWMSGNTITALLYGIYIGLAVYGIRQWKMLKD